MPCGASACATPRPHMSVVLVVLIVQGGAVLTGFQSTLYMQHRSMARATLNGRCSKGCRGGSYAKAAAAADDQNFAAHKWTGIMCAATEVRSAVPFMLRQRMGPRRLPSTACNTTAQGRCASEDERRVA